MTMDCASEYTKISKEIGWEKRVVALPTKERAMELARLTAAGDREAYKEIFLIHRFTATPMTDDGLEIVGLVFDAWSKNRHLFE